MQQDSRTVEGSICRTGQVTKSESHNPDLVTDWISAYQLKPVRGGVEFFYRASRWVRYGQNKIKKKFLLRIISGRPSFDTAFVKAGLIPPYL
jgi:hypothetical protein